jgi:hypothetical protein
MGVIELLCLMEPESADLRLSFLDLYLEQQHTTRTISKIPPTALKTPIRILLRFWTVIGELVSVAVGVAVVDVVEASVVPVAEVPEAEEPVAEEPVAEEPVAEEPVAVEPVTADD